MATHLDLEEQEQLDALKHFWARWGNLITWVLIVVLGAYAAWNGWQYWERRQAALASGLYEELSRGARDGDLARVERALSDMQSKYGGTIYAAHSGLLAAKVFQEKDKLVEAKSALTWVAEKASDDALQATARLRLASLLIGDKAYDEALKQLAGSFPKSYSALVADRRGDVLVLQGKRAEAATEYGKAYQGLDAASGDYRRLVATKLNALGVDPDAGNRAKAAS
jgi:predicted negative regulator of RcsB-dependent stress response